MAFTTKSTIACFGGQLLKLTHASKVTKCEMALNVYFPPQTSATPGTANSLHKVPVLFYLAGLTCTGDNGAEKGGLTAAASKKGIAVIFPDTSPRGLKIAGEDDSWDFGTGAGFYLDATAEPWSSGYNMYSYITKELPSALYSSFPTLDSTRVSISGHSMGGHGALITYLKNPGMYKSVSAFSAISNPTKAPWGEKVFKGYLEGGLNEGKKWDATEIVQSLDSQGKKSCKLRCLMDQGKGDQFYQQGQLLTENFEAAAKKAGVDSELTVRYHEGYDHSYYFISTFAADHVDHHAKYLFEA